MWAGRPAGPAGLGGRTFGSRPGHVPDPPALRSHRRRLAINICHGFRAPEKSSAWLCIGLRGSYRPSPPVHRVFPGNEQATDPPKTGCGIICTTCYMRAVYWRFRLLPGLPAKTSSRALHNQAMSSPVAHGRYVSDAVTINQGNEKQTALPSASQTLTQRATEPPGGAMATERTFSIIKPDGDAPEPTAGSTPCEEAGLPDRGAKNASYDSGAG